MELNLGVSGAKRTSYKGHNLRDLCLRVQADNADCDDMDQLRDLLIIAVMKEKGYIATAVEYACTRTVANSFKESAEAKEAKIKAKAQKAEASEAKIKEHIIKEAQIILLDLTMPNGKALRDCTGADCSKFGGWFSAIAEKVGSKQRVGNVLSEQQVRALQKK